MTRSIIVKCSLCNDQWHTEAKLGEMEGCTKCDDVFMIHEEDIVKTTPEWCPHCDTEVELDSVMKAQKCPNCQVLILPCTYCNDITDKPDCVKCPLES
ncbi:hypothetical protein [Phage f2b1]|nr:hypothetical protein [Phage f2b1]